MLLPQPNGARVPDSDGSPIDPLVESAWNIWEGFSRAPSCVRPSIPILYFGDRRAYWASSPRVITVGLNPSLHEFPAGSPFARFDGAEGVGAPGLDPANGPRFLSALDRYFEHKPYAKWFAAFEPILNGLGASYYKVAGRAVALHTDICSPIATNPTWSKLDDGARANLEANGRRLWHALVAHLRPDAMIISVARRHLQAIEFRMETPWTAGWRLEKAGRARPYVTETAVFSVSPGHRTTALFGPAAQTPFGTIDAAAKSELGRHLGGLLHA